MTDNSNLTPNKPPTTGRWVELSLMASVEAADAISEVFRANDVTGVAVETLITPRADEGIAHRQDTVRVVAYLPLDADAAAREQRIREGLWHLSAFDLAPMTVPTSKIVEEEDWASAWKQHFHPIRIGRRFVVKPSWHSYLKTQGDLVIELDPGMAFGTGLHPTTRMMLEALEEALNWTPTENAATDARPDSLDPPETPVPPDAANMTVFDIGTGSGILSIGAALLGAGSITAVDVDTIACRVAAENAAMNGVAGRINVSQGSIEKGTGTYDVVLANIVSSVLIDLAPAFTALLNQSSQVIISGVIEQHVTEVNDAFACAGLEAVKVARTGDWLCEELRLARHA
jgi:ribosomal protein L11 methyltransferase